MQIRQQAEQAKQTQQIPATTAVQPIQQTYTAQALRQHSRRPPLGYLPVRTGCSGYPGGSAFRSAHPGTDCPDPRSYPECCNPSPLSPPWLDYPSTPATQNATTPTAQPAQSVLGYSGSIRCGGPAPTRLSCHTPPRLVPPRSTTSTLGRGLLKPVGVVFYFDGDYWRNDQSSLRPRRAGSRWLHPQRHRTCCSCPSSPDTNRYDAGVTWWERHGS